MSAIIECVPNFSEGKNKKTIREIKDSIAKISGIKILDIHMDPDHNRSVITFIGNPESVIRAAFEGTKSAARLIDLTKHKGEHPRIGATDVIPLIPLKGITYKKCITLAKRLGKKIGEELSIPVYLYEKAASDSFNKNLANIRNHPPKKPDFGPAKPGKAGATAVGVRGILIAFNINLKTKDILVTKEIAKRVRENSGGLKTVKALGIRLKSKGITQVSMNLTDYKITPPLKVYKTVEKLSEKFGVKIIESEIIGLVPHSALPKTPKKTLRLKSFKEIPF
ncbi:MAG: glutamate formimidoyltransferase [Candidatus Peregrinibacteria bacterium]